MEDSAATIYGYGGGAPMVPTPPVANERATTAVGVNCITVWPGSYSRIESHVQVGEHGLRPGKKTIHIGVDLKQQCDLNIGDLITGDRTTGTITCPGSLVAKRGLGIKGLTMTDIFCTVCATDEEVSMHYRVAALRKQLTTESMVESMVDNDAGYFPRLSPGFQWIHDGAIRSICVNCIFESAFDFSAQMRLAQYRDNGIVQNDNNAAETTAAETTAAETKDTSPAIQIAEMQSQISQLTDMVNILLAAMKK